jgi:hypothetical protein
VQRTQLNDEAKFISGQRAELRDREQKALYQATPPQHGPKLRSCKVTPNINPQYLQEKPLPSFDYMFNDAESESPRDFSGNSLDGLSCGRVSDEDGMYSIQTHITNC